MRKLALAALLLLAATALADTPPEDIYIGFFDNVTPSEAFCFVTIDGPPPTLVDGICEYTLNPETGVYSAANGDTWWFGEGVAHFTHPLPPPAVGPFASKDGAYHVPK